MKVILNGLAALKPKTGVGHHVANLGTALQAHYPQDCFTLYPGTAVSDSIRRINRPSAPGTGNASSGWRNQLRAFAKSAAKAASQLHFRAYTSTFGFDLYHEPNFVPFATDLPTIVTVHDLSVLRFPQWHPIDRVRMHERYFRTALIKAAHVIVVSDAIRTEVIQQFNIPSDHITTVYNGIHPAFQLPNLEMIAKTRATFGLPQQFFLCVGTIEPRKNLLTVMQAFTQLPDSIREACPLLLAGPWGWKSEAERKFYDDIGRHQGIRQLGYVPETDLPALYGAATALLYPSHYEGFGLPPVEMLATDGTVIASTDAAVREVCGEFAVFIPPTDTDGWRATMLRIATDKEYRDAVKIGGQEHARQFTWDRAAMETMAVYRRVIPSTQSRAATN